RRDYRGATGDITLSCTACTIATYTPHVKNARARAMIGTLQIGVAIDRLEGHATIAAGKLHLTSWKLGSADFRFEAALDIDLAAHFDDSTVAGCVRFGATEAFRTRDPSIAGTLGLTGAP